LATTNLINSDNSGGTTIVNFELGPTTGQIHTVKNSAGDASVNNITVQPAGGASIEDPNNPLSFNATAVIKVKGAAVQFTFDATRWEITN
jgi:hypothetical protein